MDVFNSFCKIFDKCQVITSDDNWKVSESNQQASFKTLVIQNTGNKFYSIENSTYKNMTCITQKSSFFEDKDCDGVALTEIEGKTIFILSELKSSLDSCDILKAYKQIVFTYLKLYMMLSLCQGFDVDDWIIIGIIACHPPKNDDQKTQLYLEYLNIEEGTSKLDVKYLLRLLFEKKIETSLGKINFVQNIPFNEQLKNLKISLYLKTSDSINDSSSTFDLSCIV